MSDNLAAEVVCTKLAYQLTPDERVDLLVAVAQSMVNDQLAQGRQQEIAKVFSVLKTAVAQFWKRLIAGKPASLIVKSKKNRKQERNVVRRRRAARKDQLATHHEAPEPS